MDISERVDKLNDRIDKLEEKYNEAIPEIQSGIREIKVMLQERPKQEDLKNSILEQKIDTLEKRVKILEDLQTWLRRTIGGTIIAMVIEVIAFVIKMQ